MAGRSGSSGSHGRTRQPRSDTTSQTQQEEGSITVEGNKTQQERDTQAPISNANSTQGQPFDPQAALHSIDPAQLQQLMVQALGNFSTGLGALGSQLAQLQGTGQSSNHRDEKPPTYAVDKLRVDATFQEREDWIQAVEQGNATRDGRPQWLYVQWASTCMDNEAQQQWRGYQSRLHDGDFKRVMWQEFRDYVSSDYLGSNSGEVQAQKDWMECRQNERSPQAFYREWATLVRRLPGMDIDSTFMARDYWIKLQPFYHNRYAEAVTDITSAKACAEWCERIWVSRAASRNGRERDAHRKRLRSPIGQESRKLPRTEEQLPTTYSGPRPDRAKIAAREGRREASQSSPYHKTPTPTDPRNTNTVSKPHNDDATVRPSPNTTAGAVTCFQCGKPGHIQRYCRENPASEPNTIQARVQAIASTSNNSLPGYPEPSDSEEDSGNEQQ